MRPASTMTKSTTLWPQARIWTALLAIAVAALTSAAGVVATSLHVDRSDGVVGLAAVLAVTHVAAAVAVVAGPASLPFQVGTGAMLAACPLLVTDDVAAGTVVVTAGVVATAELLALAGRLGMVVERDPTRGRQQIGVTVLVAAAASALTLAIGALSGPTGLAAIVVGAIACVGVALLLHTPASEEP